jgi:hypothetical protein
MAVGRVEISSALKQNNNFDAFDIDKINEYKLSESIVYDGKRVKWCDGYKFLQQFVKIAFDQQGSQFKNI